MTPVQSTRSNRASFRHLLASLRIEDSARPLAFLALTVFVAHFFYFREFGFYEDDYAYIVLPMGWGLGDLFDYIASVVTTWPQGRPGQYIFTALVGYAAALVGEPRVLYVLGFAVVALNASLFYVLVKRIRSAQAALIGALLFCLFPAGTSHSLLIHAFTLQTALTLVLFASLCYLFEKRVLSYAIILLSLLFRESPFMVFLAVPLLTTGRWDRSFLKGWARHVAISSALALIVLGIRAALSESKTTELGALGLEIPSRIATAIVVGPWVSLTQYLAGPVRALSQWNWQLSVVAVASFAVFALVLYRLYNTNLPPGPSRESGAGKPQLLQVVLAGVVMLPLAYALCITRYYFPPIHTMGRLTWVHLTAGVAWSLTLGSLCAAGLSHVRSRWLRTIGVLILAGYLSLLVAYRFSIQLEFKLAWENQRAFWTSAITQMPDLADGTLVLVPYQGIPQTRYILGRSWADFLMLEEICRFPSDWEKPPRLFLVRSDWATISVMRDGNDLKWLVPLLTPHWETLPASNVILMNMKSGVLTREFGSIDIQGVQFSLKPDPSGTEPTWSKGALYDYLIREPGT